MPQMRRPYATALGRGPLRMGGWPSTPAQGTGLSPWSQNPGCSSFARPWEPKLKKSLSREHVVQSCLGLLSQSSILQAELWRIAISSRHQGSGGTSLRRGGESHVGSSCPPDEVCHLDME